MSQGRWTFPEYTVKERKFTLGRHYRIYAPDGRMVAYCKQKMMKLKEDIRFFADEKQDTLLFRLQATKVMDFNANLQVLDEQGNVLAMLRRKGWKSILRDKWQVTNPGGQLIAELNEDDSGMAFVRRFLPLGWLFPYHYYIDMNGRKVATIDEKFQLFGDTYTLRKMPGANLDIRVLLGLTVLVDALEGQ